MRWMTGTIATAAAVAVLGTAPARAGCDIPFELNTPASLGGAASLQCSGPWFRASACIDLQPNLSADLFYCATNTIFSPLGQWSCEVSTSDCGSFVQEQFVTNFCLQDDDVVSVWVDGASGPTVNQLGGRCPSVASVSFLGHNPPGAALAGADTDTFLWRGGGGGPFTVRLDRDGGGGGSEGERARLLARGDGGSVIGETRGRLPLRLRGTVPPSGLFEIVVAEPQPPGGGSFRGAYRLSVEADGIRRDRTLEPRRDVEP